jgi:tetratricopeptide (TPR) repeat protein
VEAHEVARPRHEPDERELFLACLELTPEERRAYLSRTCRGHRELRRRIERLLAAHRRAEREDFAPLLDLASPARQEPAGAAAERGEERGVFASPASRGPGFGVAAGLGILLLAALVAVGVAGWRDRGVAEERRHREQIGEFLVSALEEAVPYGAATGPPTVPDLLHRALARLEADPGQPVELRVELLSIVGKALLAHDDAPAAERALRRAVAEAERGLGPEHRSTLRCRVLLSSAHRHLGRTERLGEELALVLPVLRAAPRELAEELVVALRNLAHLEIEEARFEQAEATAREGLDAASRFLGPWHPETAAAAAAFALASQHSQDAEVALARSEEAYRLTRDVYRGRPEHPRSLDAEALYGRALAAAGHVAEGLARLQGVADRAAETFGTASRRAGLFAGELARLRLARGEVGPALAASATSLAAAERHFGPESHQVASALERHGEALLAARRTGEAASHLARAAEILEESLGPSHRRARAARASLALARAHAGESEEALRQLERVLAGAAPAAGGDAARVRHTLAIVQRLSGDPAEALRVQRQRLSSLARRRGGELDALGALAEIGLAYVALGSYDEATTPLLRALGAFEELHAEVTADRADVLVALGRVRMEQGRPAEALEPLEAADRFWRAHAPESRWAAEAARWLALCREALARRA